LGFFRLFLLHFGLIWGNLILLFLLFDGGHFRNFTHSFQNAA
jgi:hypothetical protein